MSNCYEEILKFLEIFVVVVFFLVKEFMYVYYYFFLMILFIFYIFKEWYVWMMLNNKLRGGYICVLVISDKLCFVLFVLYLNY